MVNHLAAIGDLRPVEDVVVQLRAVVRVIRCADAIFELPAHTQTSLKRCGVRRPWAFRPPRPADRGDGRRPARKHLRRVREIQHRSLRVQPRFTGSKVISTANSITMKLGGRTHYGFVQLAAAPPLAKELRFRWD
jgi:hypothetical protein